MRIISAIVFFLTAFSTSLFAQRSPTIENRVIDFGIIYPLPRLKEPATRRQVGTAGVTYNYQFYFSRHFGWNFNPSAWFLPIRVNGAKASLYTLAIENGLSHRSFPGTYLDPTLYLLGGIGGSNAGSSVKGKIVYPVSGGVGFNLWKETDRFKDRSLALHAFSHATYYFNAIEVMEPLFFSFGLAFRGSF